jgi:hypothetical protein
MSQNPGCNGSLTAVFSMMFRPDRYFSQFIDFIFATLVVDLGV